MYEIFNIVYGKVIGEDDTPILLEAIQKKELPQGEEPYTKGHEVEEYLEDAEYFDSYYCGNDSPSLGFVGVRVGDISCSDDGRDLNDVVPTVTEAQMTKAYEKLGELNRDLGIRYEPELQIYWSTS